MASNNVRKFLDVSTSNLTKATAQRFEDGEGWHQSMSGEYGWLVYVPEEGNTRDDAPDDLKAVIAFAQQHACDYILFDRDADPVGGLPVYDW